MISWAARGYLYLLLLLPALITGLILRRITERRRFSRQIEAALLRRLTPDASGVLMALKVILMLLGTGLLIVALARPRWGKQLQMFKGRGVAVVVALDASKSMLAEDVKPNRLSRAKAELAALFDELVGNAVGVVSFAGEAYPLCPLTTDIEAAKLFLDIISPELMPVPGTDFGRAIEVGMSLFNPGSATRVLLLVTDGEDLGSGTEEAVRKAREEGVRVYPVVFATAEGAPIPEKGEAGVAYKKDRAGNLVISRMDERKLILIAQATGGRFYRIEGFSGARFAAELNRLEKEELAGGSFSDYIERYQSFLLAGMLLLFLGLVLPERRRALTGLLPGWLVRWRGRGSVAGIILVLGLLSTARADVGSLMRAGNSHFRRGKFEEALGFYQRAEVLEPDRLDIHYNIGNTIYRLQKYEEAIAELTLATVDRRPLRRSRAWYNTGNAFYRMGRLDEAINSYKMALLANPNDRQAKENLEFCLRKKAEQSQQSDSTQPSSQPQSGGENQSPQPEVRPREGQMDREQAERILEAIQSKERETQQEVWRPRARRRVEKDW